MTLATPDFESCDPKCRCLGGELAGTVYKCNNPCASATAIFDSNSCECSESDGPTVPIDCCRPNWDFVINRRIPDPNYQGNGNYCGHPTTPTSNVPWEQMPLVDEGPLTYQSQFLYSAKYIGYFIYSGSGGNVNTQCVGYDPSMNSRTFSDLTGTDFVLQGATVRDGTELLTTSVFGDSGSVYLLFELCQDAPNWGYSEGDTFAYGGIGGVVKGYTTPIPNGISLESVTGTCTDPKIFNEDTCQCECPNECPEGYELDTSTCECLPEPGVWRYEGIIQTYSGGSPTFVPVSQGSIGVDAGDTFAVMSDASAPFFDVEPVGFSPGTDSVTVTKTASNCTGGGASFYARQKQPNTADGVWKVNASLGSGVLFCNSPEGAQAILTGEWIKVS